MEMMMNMMQSPGTRLGGTLLTAGSQAVGGWEAARSAALEGAQLDQAAGQSIAASQRAAITQQRDATYLESKALARGGASGTGTDGNVSQLISRIAAEGDLRARTALFNGQAQATSLENRASMTRYGGGLARLTGFTRAAGTLVEGGSEFARRYPTKKLAPTSSIGDIDWTQPSGID